MKNSFEHLKVFQEAHAFVLNIYKASNTFPEHEKYGLISQVRRSASSIAANIVEGNARNHTKELIQFLCLAKGSLEETKYHLLLAKDLKYLPSETYQILYNQSNTVGKLLAGFISYNKNKLST